MELFQNKDKRRGLIGTIIFHLVLLIVFLFYGLTIPVPIPEEVGGVELDLGNVDFGSGDEQPESTADPVDTEPITEPVESSPVESPEDVATQDDISDYSVPEEVKPEKPVEKEPELDEQLKKVLDSNPFKTNKDNDSKGQGDSEQPGDHGKPDGSPTGKSLSGGSGDGPQLNGFGNRNFRKKPRVLGDWQESGVIVVDVISDRMGNCVRATQGSRGTTIANAAMIKAATEAARKATIDPDPDGPAEKKGSIKFVFVLE